MSPRALLGYMAVCASSAPAAACGPSAPPSPPPTHGAVAPVNGDRDQRVPAALAERGTLQQVSISETGATVSVVGAGFRLEHDQPAFRGGVPRLGEHTDEVLRRLGITLEPRA